MFQEVFYSKSHRWNRSHCRDRYLFFYRPKMELREESKFMPMYYT